jgi:hypothetical protein
MKKRIYPMLEYQINDVRKLIQEFVAEHSEARLSLANEALIRLTEAIKEVTR